MRTKRGRTSIGCLLTILLLVAATYFGVNLGEPYLRYFRFRDAMRQEARFSSRFTDEEIQRHLAAMADSLGLPESAARVQIRRTANRTVISSSYYEHVELPLMVREILFRPQAEWPR